MGKLSVMFSWFVSLVVLLGAAALASAHAAPPLEQRDLTNPATITAWLKQNAATADKARAKQFFDAALKDKKRGAWGRAGKGFGESAQFYPTPNAITEYANAALRSGGERRAREKTYAQHSQADMTHFEALYRSALAADAILNTLSADENKQVRHNIDCLTIFIQSQKILPDCQPLKTYGLL